MHGVVGRWKNDICAEVPKCCSIKMEHWRTVERSVYLPWMEVDGVSIPEEFAICFRARRLIVTVSGDGIIKIEHEGRNLPVRYGSDGQVYCCGGGA